MNKWTRIVFAVIVCGFIAVSAAAQTNVADPTIVAQAETTPDDVDHLDDDFAPGLGIFALFMVVILLMLVVAGALLAFVVVCIAACLAAFGILTTSTLTGLLSRRPRTAVKAFFLQLGGILGLASGAGLAVLAAWLCKLQCSTLSVVITGALTGLIGGVVLAMLFNLAWEKGLTILLNRFGR